MGKIIKSCFEKAKECLAYTILVELLAYQFASPARWIETQEMLFTHYDFKQLVEVGPSPTLTGMATRTLKAKSEVQDNSIGRKREILRHSNNTKEIYYQFEDEAGAASAMTSICGIHLCYSEVCFRYLQ